MPISANFSTPPAQTVDWNDQATFHERATADVAWQKVFAAEIKAFRNEFNGLTLVTANSPAFSGTPTAPTASTATNSTQIATTAFVHAVMALLIDSAPGVLNTLNELAAALGDDPNFAATIAGELAGKLSAALSLADVADVEDARANLGLGALAILDGVGETEWTGDALSVANGGTGAANAAEARDNLGIGAAITTALVGYAVLASPAFSGNPTAPNQSAGANNTRIANTAYVDAAIAQLVASAPGLLDTFAEIAAALADDPNFAATVTTALSGKLTKTSNLADLSDVSVARSNLGLGGLAVKSSINNDDWSGADLAVANGGTGASDAAGARANLGVATGAMTVELEGFGVDITTGVKGDRQVPFGCTLTGWSLFSPQTGSIQIDIWKDTYANAPPMVADTITASAKPALAAAAKATSSSLTGWTTAIGANDVLRFSVDSCSGIQRATLTLFFSR